MFVTKDISIWQTKHCGIVLFPLPGMSLCAVSSERPFGHAPKSPAFDQSPPASSDSRESYAWGQSWQVDTVYYAVCTSPTAELVWITSKAEGDADKPNKDGRAHDVNQSDKTVAEAFLKAWDIRKLVLVSESPQCSFPTS